MDLNAFQDAELGKKLLERLHTLMAIHGQSIRFMEVCGTHTVAMFQSGIRSLLPTGLTHVSGPGCPVCVTHDSEVGAFLELAGRDGVILATFGDLMRVPGPEGLSLKHAQAQGARVKVVYSPLDALAVATQNPGDKVVFLGVGFETTAPGVAAALITAKAQGIKNFQVLCCHKLTPPALQTLLDNDAGNFQCDMSAFLLPGHVSMVLGTKPFQFIAKMYARPAAVAGFTGPDILGALVLLVEQIVQGKAEVVNAYGRVVEENGNPKAQSVMRQVFDVCNARWRGLGLIPRSGLRIKEDFAPWDAQATLGISFDTAEKVTACRCGQVLMGKIQPPECPLFSKACTPQNPIGPCMVSSEGSCSAWFNYGDI